jgi:ethanolamine utilization protein EutN
VLDHGNPSLHHSITPRRHYSAVFLARVEGNLTATRKHPSFAGWRLIICQPISKDGVPEGVPQVAIDPHGAAMHQRVIISSDGLAARKAVGDNKSPARWMIIGIVDEKEGA